MKRKSYVVLVMLVALGASACQAQTSSVFGGTPRAPLMRQGANSVSPNLGAGFIYVANPSSNLITMYPKAGSGDLVPTATLAGSNTQLNFPFDVFVSTHGKIYVTNRTNNAVTVYPSGSTGNTAPSQDIFGHNTLMGHPSGIGVDSAGDIYVANNHLNSITVFAANANGNVNPLRTISGTLTVYGLLLNDRSRLTAGLVELPMLIGDDGRVDGVALDRWIGLYRARHHNLTDINPVAF